MVFNTYKTSITSFLIRKSWICIPNLSECFTTGSNVPFNQCENDWAELPRTLTERASNLYASIRSFRVILEQSKFGLGIYVNTSIRQFSIDVLIASLRLTFRIYSDIMKLLPITCAVALISTAHARVLSSPINRQQPLHHDEETGSKSFSLLDLHRDLIQIESISGNEYAVGKYLHKYLSSHNFTVELQTVSPVGAVILTAGGPLKTKHARHNILAYRGDKRKTRTLLSSHMDTVPPFYDYEAKPHNKIWGRGSVDDKGCVAAQIVALQELLHTQEVGEGDVGLLFVVGEEIGGDGMVKANDFDLEWETVIFGEPTELKLASGHKGNIGFNIRAKGKAAHSGYPWLGVNANSLLIPALAKLDNLKLPMSKKYGNTTVNIGRMEGGVAGNVVAETASAQIQIRIADGSAEDVKKIVLDAVKSVDKGLEVEWLNKGYGPVDIDTDVDGQSDETQCATIMPNNSTGFGEIVVNYGTDIPNLKGDHKRYLYGPGSILVAHSDHEEISATDLKKAVEGYKTLIRASLKK